MQHIGMRFSLSGLVTLGISSHALGKHRKTPLRARLWAWALGLPVDRLRLPTSSSSTMPTIHSASPVGLTRVPRGRRPMRRSRCMLQRKGNRRSRPMCQYREYRRPQLRSITLFLRRSVRHLLGHHHQRRDKLHTPVPLYPARNSRKFGNQPRQFVPWLVRCRRPQELRRKGCSYLECRTPACRASRYTPRRRTRLGQKRIPPQ